MLLLMNQSKPADQRSNVFDYLLAEQWTNLTANDMRTALVNVVLENHRSQATQAQQVMSFLPIVTVVRPVGGHQ